GPARPSPSAGRGDAAPYLVGIVTGPQLDESVAHHAVVRLSAQDPLAGRAVVLKYPLLVAKLVLLAKVGQGRLQIGDELLGGQLTATTSAASSRLLGSVVGNVLIDDLIKGHANRGRPLPDV